MTRGKLYIVKFVAPHGYFYDLTMLQNSNLNFIDAYYHDITFKYRDKIRDLKSLIVLCVGDVMHVTVKNSVDSTFTMFPVYIPALDLLCALRILSPAPAKEIRELR